jgi:hypothetical protein
VSQASHVPTAAAFLYFPASQASHPALVGALYPPPHPILCIQLLHVDAPATELHVPGTQAIHALAPAALYVPIEQVVHTLTEVAPSDALYVPELQFVQTPAPEIALYVPAGHSVQALAPAALYVPAVQLVQKFTECAPIAVLYVPAVQF